MIKYLHIKFKTRGSVAEQPVQDYKQTIIIPFKEFVNSTLDYDSFIAKRIRNSIGSQPINDLIVLSR